MSYPEPSSAVPEVASRKGSTTNSMSKLLANLDMETLSPRSRAILIRVAQPMSEGFRETEIAEKLGRTPSWVSERLNELRDEILLQSGRFPPLSDGEMEALEEAIAQYGVRVPVIVDEDLHLIDGRARYIIADKLGVDCPYTIVEGLSEEEKFELAVVLNANRRHLNRLQKRTLAQSLVTRFSHWSDRKIAALCGLSHPTVADVRAEVSELHAAERAAIAAHDDQVEDFTTSFESHTEPERRLGSDGKSYPIPSRSHTPIETHATVTVSTRPVHSDADAEPWDGEPVVRTVDAVVIPSSDIMLCAVTAPCDIAEGERVEVWKVGGEYELRTACTGSA